MTDLDTQGDLLPEQDDAIDSLSEIAEYAQLPDVPDPKSISWERILALSVAIGRAHPNSSEGSRWDPATASVLWQLLGAGNHEKTADQGGIRLPYAAIGYGTNLSVKVVRDRMHLLAAFGFLLCVNRIDEKKFHQTGGFYFNPLMLQLVTKRGGRKLTKAAIEPFMAMGLARDQSLKFPQGWKGFDVEYGETEPSPGNPDSVGMELAPWAKTSGDELEALEEAATIATASAATKGMKQQERLRRAAAGEAFVRGCATIWAQAHEKRGHGGQRPAWEGPYEGLSSENKKQFRELKSLFEKFGGAKVAMAWACFVNYSPFLDEKGKLKFDPNLPHVQWVSSDKKPSHFGKHFDAVLMDRVVKDRSADEGARARIAAIIGKQFDAPPAPPLASVVAKGTST